MGAGLIDGFRSAVRAILGLPDDPGQPPDLIRLGLYRARVDACAGDGSTCDVTPEDKRISPEKNVPVRVGIPGASAVVAPGAVVMLGWERGDPGRPYCVPHWESGATVSKLTLSGTQIQIDGQTEAVILGTTFCTDLSTFLTTLLSVLQAGTQGSPAAQQLTALSGAQASLQQFITQLGSVAPYKSAKVTVG